MKDATLKDIYPKRKKPITQLCVYLEGSWQFAAPSSPVRKGDHVNYYKINKKFGIAHSTQVNPSKTVKRGEPGDYLVEDRDFAYAIMKASEYLMYFPALKTRTTTTESNGKTRTTSSKSLANPKFIEKIVEESKGSSYN